MEINVPLTSLHALSESIGFFHLDATLLTCSSHYTEEKAIFKKQFHLTTLVYFRGVCVCGPSGHAAQSGAVQLWWLTPWTHLPTEPEELSKSNNKPGPLLTSSLHFYSDPQLWERTQVCVFNLTTIRICLICVCPLSLSSLPPANPITLMCLTCSQLPPPRSLSTPTLLSFPPVHTQLNNTLYVCLLSVVILFFTLVWIDWTSTK